MVRIFNAINFQALNVLLLRTLFKDMHARHKHCFFSPLKYSTVEEKNTHKHF